jgi:hypothetical protein
MAALLASAPAAVSLRASSRVAGGKRTPDALSRCALRHAVPRLAL